VNINIASALQQRIHQAIPLSQAMGFRITELADTRITVAAPLQPNINIHGTGFAGSLYALGILTVWGLCDHVIASAALEADLVVAEAGIKYRAPVRTDIVCHSSVSEEAARSFVEELATRRRSRIALDVTVGREPCAVLSAKMYASIR
jgi:thioesterase domain-containing protein